VNDPLGGVKEELGRLAAHTNLADRPVARLDHHNVIY
jgi:hypothetical protein